MKMTRKFLLVFALILILPIVAIHQGIVRYSENVMQANIIENNEIMAELIVNRMNSEMNDVVSQLQLVAGLSDQHRLNLPMMYARAKQAISKSTIIQSIYFLDTDRRMLFEAPFRPEIQETIFDYPKFDHVKWSYTYVVSGLISNIRNEKSVTVAIPVFYDDRQFLGVLVAELSRNFLSNILRSTSETREGFSFITDNEGKVIASTSDFDWNVDFSEEPIVQYLLKGDSGSVLEAYRGTKSVMTYQTMRENWGLALGVPEKFAFSSVQTLSKALTYSFLGIFGFIGCLIFVGGRQIIVPILKVTKFAQRIQSQKGPAPLPEPMMKRKDEIGELIRTFQDMNERVDRSHRFLQDIIEGIPYALITLNEKGEVTRVNRKWVELFGKSEAEWEGKRLTEFPGYQFLKTEMNSGEREATWTDEDGASRILNVVTASFYDGLLAVVQDISQIRMLESHVKQSEQLALIGQITTGIAHELKNPLAVLSSSSELLKEEIVHSPDSEWVPTLVHDIDSEIARMTSIVNEFLTLAKTKKEAIGPVQLDDLLNRVLHLLRIKFNELGIEVRRDFPDYVPAIAGKTNKLIQVFLNLLVNSMDAMPRGGAIDIRILVSADEAGVEIADEGDGVSEEHLQWLFNPFFSTKENGNGLGLSIARDIMKEHGGSLEMNSGKFKGTVVLCLFPLGRKEDGQ
ncbi:PAS domain-containing sensor histidine kinase [Cohnella terricola]|uniref:histidine kinase n=1 Tax=Cohnella terricola TaxID=1289167 RepID=A0A559JC16_9BACL|nr:PAS domain-containing sensor histidine kinase [Cohnella terricola]TVX97420.1 HAMP domain-containing protein [Cohnella terricola]